MSRKFKVLNYLLTFLITGSLMFFTVYYSGKIHEVTIKDVIIPYIIGLVVAGLVCALAHEIGHVIFGKLNGFVLISFAIWCFRWEKRGKRFKFNFCFNFEEAGSTEMVKKENVDMKKGLVSMTIGGLLFSFLIIVFSCIIFIVPTHYVVYNLLAPILPVGAYFFFGNAIPSAENNVRNDGGVLYGLRIGDDESKVTLSILSIQTELYNGKTFSQIDEKYYFDLPQLPEDSLNFMMLLYYRYHYYLDKGDFESAIKTTSRLISLEEYMPKYFVYAVKTDALYNACTFDYNEDKADEYMYELEKCLNKNNDATSLRVKLAYILLTKGERVILEDFYNKGLKEAKKCRLKGLRQFETKLLEGLKNKF